MKDKLTVIDLKEEESFFKNNNVAYNRVKFEDADKGILITRDVVTEDYLDLKVGSKYDRQFNTVYITFVSIFSGFSIILLMFGLITHFEYRFY
jgi:hypothetical protein